MEQNMTQFEIIDDAALEQVKGGLSFSLDIGNDGISAETPLGSIKVPNPLTVAEDLIKGVAKGVGDLLSKFGGSLVKLGQLFDFS
jgi:hypothetical protein